MEDQTEKIHKSSSQRLIQLKDCPAYLGISKNRFNFYVRPSLAEFSIGERWIGFDKFDLDAWVDQYKARNGRPTELPQQEKKLWDVNVCRGLPKGKIPGTSTKLLTDAEFMKALDRAINKKQNAT